MTQNQKERQLKADIATVDYGFTTIEGLYTEEGDYAIAVPQICNLFQIAKSHASRDINQLLGKDSQLTKLRTALHPKYVNALLLDDFSDLTIELMDKGNPIAKAFIKAAIKETHERRFDNAFNKQKNEEEYNLRFKERMSGIVARRTLTDAIKDYLIRHNIEDKWIYANVTQQLYFNLTGISSVTLLKEQLNIPAKANLRDHLTDKDLVRINQIEDFVARLIDKQDIHPVTAMQNASNVLLLTNEGLSSLPVAA